MRTISRHIVGYDPTTEAMTVEYQIPTDVWKQVTAMVKHDDSDPEYVYVYPLGASVANDIVGMLGKPTTKKLDYFLQSYAD